MLYKNKTLTLHRKKLKSDSVAQLVEQLTLNQWVEGSSPSGVTKQAEMFQKAFRFFYCSKLLIFSSGFGSIISNYSDTTQQAALVMFFFLVIFILLSGLLTPISSMPEWAQAITTVNPLRYYIEAMRCIYLKSSTLMHLMHDFTALCIYAAVVCFWAIKSYKKNA